MDHHNNFDVFLCTFELGIKKQHQNEPNRPIFDISEILIVKQKFSWSKQKLAKSKNLNISM